MTEIQKLIKNNYYSIKKRGLINRKTSVQDFINKLKEEVKEVEDECYNNDINEFQIIDKENLSFEIAGVILVSLNFAEHFGIDIEKYLYEKIEINLNRKD
jgi:NTP pyrophosphatase (non-canonical NTP hydrolase)